MTPLSVIRQDVRIYAVSAVMDLTTLLYPREITQSEYQKHKVDALDSLTVSMHDQFAESIGPLRGFATIYSYSVALWNRVDRPSRIRILIASIVFVIMKHRLSFDFAGDIHGRKK
jgi:hypothetical protein